MEHLAIDLGGRESQICIRDDKGQILVERRVGTGTLGKVLRGRPPSRIIVETCAESFAVAEAALACGHQVRVVPGMLVKSLGVGARGVKNDRKDARVLSEVSVRIDLPSVHIPSSQSRQRKSQCGMREALVGARTQLVNVVRGWLRTQNVRVRSGGVESFVGRVQLLSAQGVQLPAFVQRTLESIQHLNQQLKDADAELAKLAKADPVCQRLMSVPGIGPVTSVRFVAALDQVQRFGDAAQVCSYLGLVPGEDSSSDRKRLTGITKAGSRQTRWALVQAAWSFLRWAKDNDPVLRWAKELMVRRGKKIAVVALARKLAGILFALWRDQTVYQVRAPG